LAFRRKGGVVVRTFSSLLDSHDIDYLSKRWGLERNFVLGMNDKEWMTFLGCQREDLPFYFFEECDDLILDEYADDDIFISPKLRARNSEPADIIPIGSSKKKKPVQSSLFENSHYSKPSPMAKKSKRRLVDPKKVTHHFQIIR
jgi:hypothetical protein